jgi:hypothetical protein
MLHKYTEHFLRLVCLVKASRETKGNISLVDHVASAEQAGFQPRFSALPLEEPITTVFKYKFWRGAAHHLGMGVSWDWGAFADLGELEMIKCEVPARLGSRSRGCCFSWSPIPIF